MSVSKYLATKDMPSLNIFKGDVAVIISRERTINGLTKFTLEHTEDGKTHASRTSLVHSQFNDIFEYQPEEGDGETLTSPPRASLDETADADEASDLVDEPVIPEGSLEDLIRRHYSTRIQVDQLTVQLVQLEEGTLRQMLDQAYTQGVYVGMARQQPSEETPPKED